MNDDGDRPQGSKRVKSAGGAMEGGMEESNGTEDEYDQLDSSPPRQLLSKPPTHGALRASKPTHRKKGVASRTAAAKSQASLPTAVPVWFMKVSGMLQSLDGNAAWTRLIKVWSVFEDQERYIKTKKLTATDRPEAILEWMKRHRSPTWRPSLTKTFGKSFMTWWLNLQPKWRVVDGKFVSGQSGDFSVLKRSGGNGFLVVLIGLFYWHLDLGLKEEEEEWLRIVEDCIAIIEGFLHK